MDVLELSDRTRSIIENFSKVNKGLFFRKGKKLATIAQSQDIFINATLDTAIPKDFGISDLSKFLGILSLHKEPKITVNEKTLVINTGEETYHYTVAGKEMILIPEDEEPELSDVLVEFDLPLTRLQSAVKNIQVANLPELAFFADKKNISLVGFDSKMPTGDIYSAKLGKCTKSFKIIFKNYKFLNLMDNDYHVSICEGAAKFVASDITYFVTSEENSKYN